MTDHSSDGFTSKLLLTQLPSEDEFFAEEGELQN